VETRLKAEVEWTSELPGERLPSLLASAGAATVIKAKDIVLPKTVSEMSEAGFPSVTADHAPHPMRHHWWVFC
jgi:hypothetical protein